MMMDAAERVLTPTSDGVCRVPVWKDTGLASLMTFDELRRVEQGLAIGRSFNISFSDRVALAWRSTLKEFEDARTWFILVVFFVFGPVLAFMFGQSVVWFSALWVLISYSFIFLATMLYTIASVDIPATRLSLSSGASWELSRANQFAGELRGMRAWTDAKQFPYVERFDLDAVMADLSRSASQVHDLPEDDPSFVEFHHQVDLLGTVVEQLKTMEAQKAEEDKALAEGQKAVSDEDRLAQMETSRALLVLESAVKTNSLNVGEGSNS